MAITTITDEEWKVFEGKYGRLMHMISQRISGDPHTCNLADNYMDLCASALCSISSYAKKMSLEPKNFLTTEEFGKYVKTCLWNAKNKKGSNITKKRSIYNSVSLYDFTEEHGTNHI